MLTTRRQFLAQTVGGLLLASSAVRAQIVRPVHISVPAGSTLFVAPDYAIVFLLSASGTEYRLVVTKQVPVISKQPFGTLNPALPLSVSIQGASLKGSEVTAAANFTLKPTGETVLLLHKSTAGNVVCRGSLTNSYNHEKGLLTLTFFAS